jgi:chromate transporter
MGKTPTVQELFLSFLRLGLTAFGGPAMVANIRKMAVGEKGWLSEASFRDGAGLCQIIPGATAMQAAAYVGLRARGIGGAAAIFLPSCVMITGLVPYYDRLRSSPLVSHALRGILLPLWGFSFP